MGQGLEEEDRGKLTSLNVDFNSTILAGSCVNGWSHSNLAR